MVSPFWSFLAVNEILPTQPGQGSPFAYLEKLCKKDFGFGAALGSQHKNPRVGAGDFDHVLFFGSSNCAKLFLS